jgi:hypothetical protein
MSARAWRTAPVGQLRGMDTESSMLSVRRNQPSAFVHGMQTSPHIVQIPARGRFADIETNEIFRRLVENERDILRLVLDTFEGLKMTYPKTSAKRQQELQSTRKRLAK